MEYNLKEQLIDKIGGLKLLVADRYGAEYNKGVDASITRVDNFFNDVLVPEVPQFVADWLEYCKKHNFTLFGCFDPVYNFEDVAGEDFKGDARKCIRWCRRESEIFAFAWLNGYRIKEDKKYLVKLKHITKNSSFLKYDSIVRKWYFGMEGDTIAIRLYHTKEELIEAGFEEVFDSQLFEVKEKE